MGGHCLTFCRGSPGVGDARQFPGLPSPGLWAERRYLAAATKGGRRMASLCGDEKTLISGVDGKNKSEVIYSSLRLSVARDAL